MSLPRGAVGWSVIVIFLGHSHLVFRGDISCTSYRTRSILRTVLGADISKRLHAYTRACMHTYVLEVRIKTLEVRNGPNRLLA